MSEGVIMGFRTLKTSLLSAIFALYVAGCPKPNDDDTVVGDDDTSQGDDDSTTDDDDTTLDQLPVFKQLTSFYTTLEGVNFSNQYTATNAVSYSIQTTLAASKYSFNSVTGVLQLLNTNDAEVGIQTFTIRASNTYGDADHQSTITIENVNEAPVMVTTSLPAGVSGDYYQEQIIAVDEDLGDTLQYAVTSGNVPGLTLTSDGILFGDLEQLGNYSLTIKVEDSNGLNDQQTYQLSVTPAATLTVNVRDAYGGAHSPTFLSGIEVLFDTPYESVSGVTDSSGNVTFTLNAVSAANNVLTVRDETQQGLGPNNDCSILPGGVTLDDCVGDWNNVTDPDVVISGGNNARDVWLIGHSDSDMSQTPCCDDFLTYFKNKADMLTPPWVYLARWDADGDPGRFPLNVYNPSFTNSFGIDYDDQSRIAINAWNSDPFGVQYLVETSSLSNADIELDYSESNSYNNPNFTQVATYEWQYIPIDVAHIDQDFSQNIAAVHTSAHELGHALGHIGENSGDPDSVWGMADLPGDNDHKFVYILNFLPDPDTTKHKLD